MEMKRSFLFLLCVLLIPAGGCYYTLHSTSGNEISSTQIQEIKLGKTTEIDLIRLLGEPSRKVPNPSGTVTLQYIHEEIKSVTLPGGYVIYGLLDREVEEIFEVITKDGVVQSYHFIKK